MKSFLIFLLVIFVTFYVIEADPFTCSVCKSSFTTFVSQLQTDPTVLTSLAKQLQSGMCDQYTNDADNHAACLKFISFEGFAQVVRDTSVDPTFGIDAMCSGYCQ